LASWAIGELGDALALLLLALDTGLPRVLHREHAPGALERRLERRRVVEVSARDLRPERGQRLRGLALGLAGHGPHLVTGGQQLPGHGAALLAGRAGHQDQVFAFLHVSTLL
jgi:hypothetical protein